MTQREFDQRMIDLNEKQQQAVSQLHKQIDNLNDERYQLKQRIMRLKLEELQLMQALQSLNESLKKTNRFYHEQKHLLNVEFMNNEEKF